MITIKSDNRVLTNSAKFAYLTQNNASNVGSVVVSNTAPFDVGTPILLSEIGQTDAEVLKVRSITGTTIALGDVDNLAITTTYSHAESTKVVALQYDRIRFFWTPLLGTIADETPTFNDTTPLTGWTAFDPSSFYSTYSDPDHSTGFGWFMYLNATTGETSQVSNPVPYAGFTLNTAKQVFSDFESLLNTNELKLISLEDKFSWLNEALTIYKNKLNLSSVEYTVSTRQTITTTASTAEYIQPDDFSDVVEITDVDGTPLDFIPVSQVMANNGTNPSTSASAAKYYLRGRYIGFSPTPTAIGTIYYYTYKAKAVRVTSLSTYIDLPDNAFYSLKDWMLYRAHSKFSNPLAATDYTAFKNSMDIFIQSSVKRSANLDTWGITNESNA